MSSFLIRNYGLLSDQKLWAPFWSEIMSMLPVGSCAGIVGTMCLSSVLALFVDWSTSTMWQMLFYLTGGVSLVWCLFWFLLAYNRPEEHPHITPQELRIILDSLGVFGYGVALPRCSTCTCTSIHWKILWASPLHFKLLAGFCEQLVKDYTCNQIY